MRAFAWAIATLACGCGGSSDTARRDGAQVASDVAIDVAPDAISPTLGVAWEPAGANPIIGDGGCPSWHCKAASDPTLTRAPDGSLALFFTTVGIVSNGSGGYVANLDIGHASADETLAFAITPDAALMVSPTATPAWDANSETWFVRRFAGMWNAWFLGYPVDLFHDPGLGQMQSADGVTWTRPAAPIYQPTAGAWDSALISGPSVVHGPDGVYRLYYSGVGADGASIGMLTSTDGTTWTPYANNPVFHHADPGNWDSTMLEQTVLYFAGRYWMWYSGYDGELTDSTRISIGLATSSDGVTWQRYPSNPVLPPGAPGTWNDLRTVSPDVLVDDDGSLLLVAHGQAVADPTSDEPGRLGIWRSR
jgi:hypothetical protein